MKTVKLASLFIGACLSLNAWALSLDEAKNQGLVGETPSGYLATVTATPAAQKLVAEINAKRKATYAKLASKNGITLAQVEALAGAKAIEKTAKGNLIQVNGKWQKK